MINPLVSIIIPVYNAEKYLEQTIISAINQTWSNKEIIIVDDGSTDNSLSIAKKYQADWIKIFTQQNKGASAARNRGLLEANGDYIQFLDADDLLSTNKIRDQVNLLNKNPDKVAVCSTVHFSNEHDITNHTSSQYEDSFLIDTDGFSFLINLLGGNTGKGSMVQPNAWLTPKNVIKKAGSWNEELTIDDDGEYFCRVLLSSNGVLYSKNAVSYYRKYISDLSLSSGRDLDSIKSQYRAILLKKDHLKALKDDKRIDLITARSLMELVTVTYPEYKELSADIMLNIRQTGVTVGATPMGGPVIETIKKLFGWKTARLLQYYYNYLTRLNK